MRSSRDFITIILFLCLLFGIGAATLFVPDRDFSQNENRYLAQKPDFNREDLLSGEFEKGLERYMSDQLIGREQWVEIRTDLKLLAGNRDLSGVYIGEDGYLIEKILSQDLDEELIRKNILAVKELFRNCGEKINKERLSFLIVPTAGLVLEEKLPKHAAVFDQSVVIDKIQAADMNCRVVDLQDAFANAQDKDAYYYKTDHHWTSRGSFEAYKIWCREMGFDEPKDEQYKKEQVSDHFLGSLYSKALWRNAPADTVELYKKKDGVPVSIEYSSIKNESDSFFDRSRLDEKDQYKVFLGGNDAEIKIHTDLENGRRLLVIKDSYANCFVPFAAEQFEDVFLLDLRYFNGSVKQYLGNHEITDVLVLYNVENFVADKNLRKCVK